MSVEDGPPREAVVALVHIVWLEIVVDEEGA